MKPWFDPPRSRTVPRPHGLAIVRMGKLFSYRPRFGVAANPELAKPPAKDPILVADNSEWVLYRIPMEPHDTYLCVVFAARPPDASNAADRACDHAAASDASGAAIPQWRDAPDGPEGGHSRPLLEAAHG